MKIGTCVLLVVMVFGCKKEEPKPKGLAGLLGGLKIKGDDGTEVTFTKDGLVAKGKDGETVVMGKEGLVAHGKDGTVTMTADPSGKGMVIKGPDGKTVRFEGDGTGKGMVIKGPDGELVKLRTDGKVSTITANDGTVTLGAGAADKDFPLPVVAGAKVLLSSHDKKGVFTMSAQVTTPAAEVADFYEAALKKKGMTVKRQNAGPMIVLKAKGDGAAVDIMCTQPNGKQPGVLTVVWKKAK